MYALLAAALGCLGAAAGGLAFTGDRSLVVPFANAVNRCAIRFPVAGFPSPNLAPYDQCDTAAHRGEAWLVLATTVIVPAVTAGLVLVLPVLDRIRLARAGRWEESPPVWGATASFEQLRYEVGLADGPRLVVAAAARQAEPFTIRPLGRQPTIVIPPATAFAYRDRRRFAPPVLHELAHVRARDVHWVCAVRGLIWVTIPLLVIASVPALLGGGSLEVERTFLVQAGVFAVFVLLLRAALLRQRETYADRQATCWLGSDEPMRGFLAAEPLGGRGPSRLAGLLLAQHPPRATRIAALADPLGARDSGFAYALATGAVAAMVINTAYFIAWSFDISLSGQIPLRVAAIAGGLVLGLALGPELVGRAARAREARVSPRWWRSVAGAGLGLFLGSLVPPGTALGATVSFFFGHNLTGAGVALILAFVGAGIVVLTAGLARLAVSIPQQAPGPEPLPGPQRFPARWVTPLVTVAMTCCAAYALFPVPDFDFDGVESRYLVYVLPDDQWRWLALAYPVAVIALAAMTSTRRGLLRRGAGSLLTPLLAAAVTTAIFFPHYRQIGNASTATIARLVQEQWWVTVLAGLAVLVVLGLRHGVSGVARACLLAWLATLLAGLGLTICGAVTFGWSYYRLLSFLLTSPSVWLFYCAVVGSLAALLRAEAPDAFRVVGSGPARQRWASPVAAGLVAVAVTVTVVATGIPWLFVPRAPAASPATPSAPRLSRPKGSRLANPGATAPGAILSNAAAALILTKIGAALPANWARASIASSSTGHTTVTPTACIPFVEEQYFSQLSRRLIQDSGEYKLNPGFIDGSETLEVFVSSYQAPVPAAFFTVTGKDKAACPRFTDTEAGGASANGTVQGVPVPGLPFPAMRFQISIHTQATSGVLTWVDIGIGHNLIILNQVTELTGNLAEPNDAVLRAAEHAVTGA
jgi:hypothetical protein